MTTRPTPSKPSTAAPPQAKPLPPGYLWRLAVILVLLIGGSVCMFFFNSVLGGLLTLAGFAFGKYSGLNKMVDDDAR